MFLIQPHGHQQLPATGEVHRAHPLAVHAFDHGQRLFRHGIPYVDLGLVAYLSSGYHVLVAGMLVDAKADNVIGMLEVEAEVACKI